MMALKEKTGKKGNWFGSPTPGLHHVNTTFTPHGVNCRVNVYTTLTRHLHHMV